jgi:serine/threonine protein kinase/WD40 repeat protein/tetratricopeptide (TPR) repeat protein
MSESTADRNPFERLAEEFAERLRHGEHPAITDYVARYPEHADDIRELFPEIALVEQHKPARPARGMSLPAAMPAHRGGLPEQFGGYRILRYLGEGGMGVVYEAVRESLLTNVALKVMHPQFRAREKYLRRFRIEARSAARLHHTNIVSVSDYGVHDGVCYYAMQYIAGHSLDKILADVRRLRQEKEASPIVETATMQPGQEGPSRPDGGSVPPQPDDATMDASRRAVSIGLLTGQWSLAPMPQSSHDGETPPRPAASAAGRAIEDVDPLEDRTEALGPGTANAGENGDEPAGAVAGIRHTALRRLALELAQTDGEIASTLEPSARSADAPGREPPATGDSGGFAPGPSAFAGSASSLIGKSEVRYYREVARLGAQVADALAYAHRRGVLHRDIKPPNLILDALGNVWITDFGLAKFDDGDDLSQSHDLVGTLRYMAPERFHGVSDPRCDLYALGATLYEMLTLHPTFKGDDQLQLIHRIEHEPPVPPRQLERSIPADLETIVLKALAKNPADRFASAEEMAAELRRYLENRPIRSRPIPAYQRFGRWCKRNPWLAAANIAAAVATTTLAVVSTVAAISYSEQLHALQVEQQQTRKAERQQRLELGRSLLTEGKALQRSGQAGKRFDSLDRLHRAAQILGADPEERGRLPEIRDHAIAAMGLVDLRVRFEREIGDVVGRSVDAALERYAFMEQSGDVVVRRLDDDRDLVRLPGPDRRRFRPLWTAFSPDGGLLMAGYRDSVTDQSLRVWHLGRRELLGGLPMSRGGWEFDPEGRGLLFAAPEGGIAVWDRDQRRVVRRLPLDYTPYHMAFDPEGRRLAVANRDRAAPRVVILDVETGCVLADWRAQVGTNSPTWSADGRLLAVGGVGGEDPYVYVWDVRRQTLQSILQGHTTIVVAARFAHSGYLLATYSYDGTTRLWDAVSGEPLAMAQKQYLGFAPDDRRLAFATGGGIGVWDVSTAPERRMLHAAMTGNRAERREAGVQSAQFSPDGRIVATGFGEGVRLWEPDTGRELAHLRAGNCDSVLFDPDGRGIITSGKWGLFRWPIRPDPGRGPDAIRVGPPELLWEGSSGDIWHRSSWLPDHRTLALIENASARVVLVDTRHSHPAWGRAIALDAGENRRMTSVAVSPDGHWLAVGGWYEAGVRVWDLPRRRLERILRPQDAASITKFFVGFSPDGRWLVSSTLPDASRAAYHFWRVGTWEIVPQMDHGHAGDHAPVFTDDARLMALLSERQISLTDVATGRELARLPTLQPVRTEALVFSPDGTKLVVSTDQNIALLWDLRRIRDQLAPMGLDWDAPPYPTAPAASEAPGPLPPPRSVRVEGEVVETQARRAGELAEMNRRIAADPDDAEARIHRGWLRLGLSQPAEAVADLERGVRLRPDDTDALFLLSQAYSQANRLPEARATLETYLARSADDIDARARKGQLALRLGRLPEADDDYTRVLEADPGRHPDRYRRAHVRLRLGRFQEALADLEPIIQRYPKDPALYELRSQIHDRLGHRELAQADRKRAVELPGGDAQQYNNLAWRLATGPAELRNPQQALALARKAVAMAPGQATYLNTLGVAQFRAGLYAEAIDTLEKSLAASKGQSDGFDLFFLAMARHRLGRDARARADFDRALRWRRDHPNLTQPQWAADLDAFQAEAKAALGGPGIELPDDVFAAPP